MRLRVPNTIRSGFDHSFNLANFTSRWRFSLPPSVAYAYSYTSIPHSAISRVSVASFCGNKIWPRGMGHFRTEMIHSLIDRFLLSIIFGALNLPENLLGVMTVPQLRCWNIVSPVTAIQDSWLVDWLIDWWSHLSWLQQSSPWSKVRENSTVTERSWKYSWV